MSAGEIALALVALALGAVVLVVVAVLLGRVHRPLREIGRYADDTLAAGMGIAANLDGLDELARTRDLGAALADGVAGSP